MRKGAHLGDLEELVLLCVRRLGQQADGSSVRAELAERGGRKVSVSTVYVTLMRLEEKGYARSWMGEPTSERGGKARRFFEPTPAGIEALEARRAVRDRLWAPASADAGRSGA